MRKFTLLLTSILVLLAFTGCGTETKQTAQSTTPTPEPTELNVSAALGLKEAMLDIQSAYEKSHPGTKIVYNFAAAGVLATQIENGAATDIFLSAAQKQINDLKAKGLIVEDSVKPIVGNQLVLAVPKGNPLNLTSFNDLTKPEVKHIGFGELKTMPAGQYGKECLDSLGIWNEVEPKIVMGKNVREIVAYVETGNADAAIAFSTVVATNPKVAVAAISPTGTHKPVIFPGTIIKETKHIKQAQDFFEYLSSKEAMDIFTKYGFSEPTPIKK